MSCDACLTCPHSGRLWGDCFNGFGSFGDESRRLSSDHFRLSDWWHFRSWLCSVVGMLAYKWIHPKDPVSGSAGSGEKKVVADPRGHF